MIQNKKTTEKQTFFFLFQIIKDTNMKQQNGGKTKRNKNNRLTMNGNSNV